MEPQLLWTHAMSFCLLAWLDQVRGYGEVADLAIDRAAMVLAARGELSIRSAADGRPTRATSPQRADSLAGATIMNPTPIPVTATLRLICLQAQLAHHAGNRRALRDAITTASMLLAARANRLTDDELERADALAN